jgi:hypothetical protein
MSGRCAEALEEYQRREKGERFPLLTWKFAGVGLVLRTASFCADGLAAMGI